MHNLIPPQALKLIINNIFFPTKRAPQCQSRPLILFVRQSSLAGQCVSKYVSSLSLSNELHRKSCGRFVIFCWKMINARHSCGICQTLKNPTLPLKRTPWSTKIIHSHIWSPPPFPSLCPPPAYLKHTSMLDNKGRRRDGTFPIANKVLVGLM